MKFLSTAVVLGLSVLAMARPQPERRAKAQLITRCTAPKTAALTFDDGPYIYMYDLVNTLNAANATATFFFNGNNFGCIYSEENVNRIKYAYNNRQHIASHTWSHKDLTTLSWDQIHDEMWRVEQALVRITGAYPAFMRPPYGNYNDLFLEASGVRGQAVTLWDLDSGDSLGQSVAQQKNNYNAKVNQRPSTILALNHEVHSTTVYETIPYAIQLLQGAGYRLVSVAECLGQPAYQSVVAPSARTPDWKC